MVHLGLGASWVIACGLQLSVRVGRLNGSADGRSRLKQDFRRRLGDWLPSTQSCHSVSQNLAAANCQPFGYSTTCAPSSTTRFDGILKKAVALPAFRNMAMNSSSRQ